MNYRLSIVIPTYNSADVLAPNLKVLLPQIKIHKEVELVIINNGSTDNTKRIILENIKNYESDRINIVERYKTIDAMDNFDDGVSRANGEYVLLLGDDDILCPSFISIVLPYLDGKLGVFHYNKILGEDNFADNILPFRHRSGISPVIYYSSFADFLKEYTSEFNFMSSIIFKKSVWNEGLKINPFRDFCGYRWYATIVYGALDSTATYFYFPLVIQRVRNRSWSSQWPLFWIGEMFSIFKDLDRYIPGLYKLWYERHHDRRIRHFYAVLGIVSKHKSYYKDKVAIFKNILSPSEMRLYWILLNAPTSLSAIYRKFFTILKLIKANL